MKLTIFGLMIILLGIYVSFELGFHFFAKRLNRRFQWLILAKDKTPIFSNQLLEKFFQDGFDPELGWSRKPNTTKNEQGKEGVTTYHINTKGARMNPSHEDLPVLISTFGDSFTFGRQVNDNQTYQWYLSQLTNTNVVNYGVGNYGLDQALLRLQREYDPSHKIVIMGVVPSTIVRIGSMWKHYNEFGNILAFKPRYKIANGNLKFYPNLINTPEKFRKYQDYLPQINAHDDFYQTKFLRELLHFPYAYTLLSNPKRHFSLLKSLISHDQNADKNALAKIMEWNLVLRKKLFKDPHAILLLEQLIAQFAKYARAKDFVPVLLWMPQKDDVLAIQKNGSYYAECIQKMSTYCKTIDMTPSLLHLPKLDDYYSEDSIYGGHFSDKANQLVAKSVYQFLSQNEKYQMFFSQEIACST